MSDLKSKLPDLSELSSMADTLYHGVKDSIVKIIAEYKEKHKEPPVVTPVVTTPPVAPVAPAEPKVVNKKAEPVVPTSPSAGKK